MGLIDHVEPKENHRLEVHLRSGSIIVLDLASRLGTIRFGRLADDAFFRTACTDGHFVRWSDNIEISLHEIIQLAMC